MMKLLTHRTWLITFAAALALMAASAPLLSAAQKSAAENLRRLSQERAQSERNLQQMRDDKAEVGRISGSMSANEAARALAPVNRQRAAQNLEQAAASALITNLVYTFSPERMLSLDTAGAGAQSFATSQVTLSGKAPTDTEVTEFIERLAAVLPGKLTLRRLALHKIDERSPQITAANIAFEAELEWLSNGASPTLSEVAP